MCAASASWRRCWRRRPASREADVESMRQAAPLHDVGKMPSRRVLNKPGRLDAEEWAIMQTHARIGFEMLGKSDKRILQLAAVIAHEHPSAGTARLSARPGRARQIIWPAAFVALAIAADALASQRCYKNAWRLDEALDHVGSVPARIQSAAGAAVLQAIWTPCARSTGAIRMNEPARVCHAFLRTNSSLLHACNSSPAARCRLGRLRAGLARQCARYFPLVGLVVGGFAGCAVGRAMILAGLGGRGPQPGGHIWLTRRLPRDGWVMLATASWRGRPRQGAGDHEGLAHRQLWRP